MEYLHGQRPVMHYKSLIFDQSDTEPLADLMIRVISLVSVRNNTSAIQSHDSQHHVLVKRIFSVQFLKCGYDTICIDSKLGFPQVVDEGVGDLAK